MQIIEEKYNKARIHTDIIEDNVIEQIKEMCNLEELKDSKIEIMPDCHLGKGCVIGTTIKQKINKPINPAYVGVDIGCGVTAIEFKILDDNFDEEELFKELDRTIRGTIPFGTNIRKEYICSKDFLDSLHCKDSLDDKVMDRARKSLGTLGGGNHFIELDKRKNGNYLLVVHSGSRNLGKNVAETYMKKCNNNGFLEKIEDIVKYFSDTIICQLYALENRHLILKLLIDNLGREYDNLEILKEYNTTHNYIEILREEKEVIIRKGSIRANKDELVLIPINMKDGLIIGIGKGNNDINNSAPHGAGRLMARRKAKEELSIEDFKEQMKGIWSTCISQKTLDEAPDAYKSIESIIDNINKMVTIEEIVKPIYNFKA